MLPFILLCLLTALGVKAKDTIILDDAHFMSLFSFDFEPNLERLTPLLFESFCLEHGDPTYGDDSLAAIIDGISSTLGNVEHGERLETAIYISEQLFLTVPLEHRRIIALMADRDIINRLFEKLLPEDDPSFTLQINLYKKFYIPWIPSEHLARLIDGPFLAFAPRILRKTEYQPFATNVLHMGRDVVKLVAEACQHMIEQAAILRSDFDRQLLYTRWRELDVPRLMTHHLHLDSVPNYLIPLIESL